MAKRLAGAKKAGKTAKSARKSATRQETGSAAKGGGASGPVTLNEARALAAAKFPKQAIRKAAAPDTSLAAVGKERKRLEAKRRAELARREREYKATMEIMKARGARRPKRKAAAKGGSALAKAAAFQPLQVFAEGNSWFDYPVPFFGGGVIPRLEDKLGVPILNLAKAGDEVRYMLGVEQRILLTKHLKEGSPAGDPWDMLLFSGGGNDIVDNPMALWVRDWNAAVPPADHINSLRFGAAMGLVRAGFEDLIVLRDRHSPNTHLVFHGYDFGIPDGRGICFLGPWLKPTFDLKKFPNQAARSAVVEAMLLQFAAMLTSLAARPKVSFINGQGLLAPNPSSWHNELHPSAAGFDKFAELFYQRIKALFPGRVA